MFNFYYNLDDANKLIFLILSMIFLHVIADYKIQDNFISTYKQKKNWEEYIKKDKQYRYDYIVVLLVHSFSWSIITFLPLLLELKSMIVFSIIILINTIFHSIVDDLKTNKFTLNLIEDQFCYLGQIVITLYFSLFFMD